MSVPIDEVLRLRPRVELTLAAATLDQIAAVPGGSELARSVAEIIKLVADHLSHIAHERAVG